MSVDANGDAVVAVRAANGSSRDHRDLPSSVGKSLRKVSSKEWWAPMGVLITAELPRGSAQRAVL
jgi:hypothetical protein